MNTKKNPSPVQHSDAGEALEHFSEMAAKHFADERWICVAASISEDGTLKLSRTTYNFPSSMFLPLVVKLGDNLVEELFSQETPPAELPLADLLALQEKIRRDREMREKVQISPEEVGKLEDVLQFPAKTTKIPSHIVVDSPLGELSEEEKGENPCDS